MAIFRTKPEETHDILIDKKLNDQSLEWTEDESINRIEENAWLHRYSYERDLILREVKESDSKKILELGSGPGKLMDMCLQKNSNLSWMCIDRDGAVEVHKEKGFKGKIVSRDLMNKFDIQGLDTDYDMIVANDILEHIGNPSDVLCMAHEITSPNAKFFVSVPNWRMGHVFLYRGLFDYDNWIYTMRVHGWNMISVYPANLKCAYMPKLDSEFTMPDELIESWNWYFVAQKREYNE